MKEYLINNKTYLCGADVNISSDVLSKSNLKLNEYFCAKLGILDNVPERVDYLLKQLLLRVKKSLVEDKLISMISLNNRLIKIIDDDNINTYDTRLVINREIEEVKSLNSFISNKAKEYFEYEYFYTKLYFVSVAFLASIVGLGSAVFGFKFTIPLEDAREMLMISGLAVFNLTPVVFYLENLSNSVSNSLDEVSSELGKLNTLLGVIESEDIPDIGNLRS